MNNLCITTYNRYDLLIKLFKSIDHNIENIFLIINSRLYRDNKILDEIKQDFPQLEIYDPGYNLGLAASWNVFIKKFINKNL